jgi:DNA topoisomerase-1
MNVVIVESPAKAKTINKYLGSGYTVIASFGHVRDLCPEDGAVDPANDFSMKWCTEGRGEKRIREIAQEVKGAKQLFLATDPDREGEAISWHLQDELRRRRILNGIEVKRVVFNEVTKKAVEEAFRHPRDLDPDLIDAYLARRALDYLVGFTLSPILWRKLPKAKSAGRVQSVALRLICEREAEIEAFRPREYWTIEAEFRTAEGAAFTARLTHLDGRKLDKFDLPDEAAAKRALEAITAAGGWKVASLERKQVRRHPPPPFTTSTLQQEASRKLGLSASRTMRIAQDLYEGVDIGGDTVGLITYMRTDGVSLSDEAIGAARRLINGEYGARYVPPQPRLYKSQAKNAQEAHEAIRPTDMARRTEEVARYLHQDHLRLYELVWKRAVASQMESAVLDQVTAEIANPRATFRAVGTTVVFDGFLRLYQEDRDDTPEESEEEQERRLPPLAEGDPVERGAVRPQQHFTQPPPRYTEASLVKKLEELGIGRPSTYASILQVLQDREYVRLEKKRFVPEDRGRLVTAFLASFFERIVRYDFTAKLEDQLDEISGGRADWKQVLRDFWRDFYAAVEGTKELRIADVIEKLDEQLGRHFFPDDGSGKDPRLCPGCGAGRLSLKLGKFGAFIGCSNYPECRYTRRLAIEGANGDAAEAEFATGPRVLGEDPATGEQVTVRKGPWGFYVQLGEGEKPKRVSVPKGMSPSEIDLETALKLLALPREIGPHPDTGEMIYAGLGRFGPYLKHGKVYRNIAQDELLTIGLNRAVALLAEARPSRGRGKPEPLRELGPHPETGEPVQVFNGRYGPYVAHRKVYATLPKDTKPEELTLEAALQLLSERAAKASPKRASKRKAGSKTAVAEPAAKSTKKTAAKASPKTPAKNARKTAAKTSPKRAGKRAASG